MRLADIIDDAVQEVLASGRCMAMPECSDDCSSGVTRYASKDAWTDPVLCSLAAVSRSFNRCQTSGSCTGRPKL